MVAMVAYASAMVAIARSPRICPFEAMRQKHERTAKHFDRSGLVLAENEISGTAFPETNASTASIVAESGSKAVSLESEKRQRERTVSSILDRERTVRRKSVDLGTSSKVLRSALAASRLSRSASKITTVFRSAPCQVSEDFAMMVRTSSMEYVGSRRFSHFRNISSASFWLTAFFQNFTVASKVMISGKGDSKSSSRVETRKPVISAIASNAE